MRPSADAPRDYEDRIVRSLLSRADNLADFLRFAVPLVAARFRFDLAQPMPREAIAEDLRKREADVPFLFPFQADEGEVDVSVHVVLEHQAAPDVAVPLRQLLVATSHWNHQWVEWTRAPVPRPPLRLDPVYAIVLYTGDRAWTGARTLGDLIRPPILLAPAQPGFTPLFWNIGEHTAEALLAGGPMMQMLAVIAAADAATPEYLRVNRAAAANVASLSETEGVRWEGLVHGMIHFGFACRTGVERDGIAAGIRETNPRRTEEINYMARTIAEEIVERERPRVVREGLRTFLREELESKFGSLPSETLARIEAVADDSRLKAAIRSVQSMVSLGDLKL